MFRVEKVIYVFLFTIFSVNIVICTIYGINFRYSSIPLLIAIILLLLIKSKFNWFGFIFLCLYGVYDIFYVGSMSSNVLVMDFMYPAHVFIKKELNVKYIGQFVSLIPLIFYCLQFIFLMAKSTRRTYGFEL